VHQNTTIPLLGLLLLLLLLLTNRFIERDQSRKTRIGALIAPEYAISDKMSYILLEGTFLRLRPKPHPSDPTLYMLLKSTPMHF